MGFEFVYAYLENLFFLSFIITAILAITLIGLIIVRFANDIDKDDWIYLVGWNSVLLLLFIIIDISPSMAHIVKARVELETEYNETKPKEIKNEEVVVPSLLISHPASVCR